MPDPGTNYTITYRPGNYGTGSVQTQVKIAGRSATLKNAIFTRTGYTQKAWSTWADGHSWNYNLGGSYSTDANITLYPYWDADTYTVSYNKGANGSGTNTSDTKTYGVSLTLKGAIFTRTGYTQTGWSTTDGGAKAYDLNDSYTSNAAVTLYPYWTVNTYTVSYNKGASGTGTNTSDTKTYGVALTLKNAIFTRTGYTQTGWATSDGGTLAYTLGGSYTANAAVTLYPVWTATVSTFTVTSSVPADGSTQGTVSITRYSSSYTHTVKITFGSHSATYTSVATSKTFTIPTSWCAQIPNATSGTATVTVTTYNGGTSLGSTSKTFTITVPASVKPTVTLTGTNQSTNVAVSSWGILVQGYSKIALSASASGVQGSSITNIVFSGDGVSQSGSGTTATSSMLTTAGSRTWTVTVTDSRGRTGTATLARTVYAYSGPSISNLSAVRSLSDGTADETSGTYITSTATYAIASCDGNNIVTVSEIEYKQHTAAGWTTGQSSAASGTAYTFGGGNIAITNVYDVRFTLTDSVGNTTTYVVTVSSVAGVSFGLNGQCARFGGPVQYADRFECDWDAQFDGVVDIVPRRCFASLSSAGWYRALTFSVGYSTSVKFASSARIEFCIRSTYSNYNNMLHSVVLNGIYNHAYFSDETSYSNTTTPIVDKIRYTYNSSTYIGYVDIHYAANNSNSVYVDFDVKYGSPESQKYFTASALESVADAPSGETVMTTYTLAANTDVDVSSLFSSSLGSVSAYRCGNMITVTFMGTNTNQTWHEDDAVMTIAEGARPKMTYIDVVGQIKGNVCVVRLRSSGSSVIWVLPSSKTGRLYFSTTYPVN